MPPIKKDCPLGLEIAEEMKELHYVPDKKEKLNREELIEIGKPGKIDAVVGGILTGGGTFLDPELKKKIK